MTFSLNRLAVFQYEPEYLKVPTVFATFEYSVWAKYQILESHIHGIEPNAMVEQLRRLRH